MRRPAVFAYSDNFHYPRSKDSPSLQKRPDTPNGVQFRPSDHLRPLCAGCMPRTRRTEPTKPPQQPVIYAILFSSCSPLKISGKVVNGTYKTYGTNESYKSQVL